MFFFSGLALIHYGLYQLFPDLYFSNEIILSYALLFILNSMGSTLFFLSSDDSFKIDFAQLFLAFTTLQMLVSFAFSAYIKIRFDEHAKSILSQFIVLFLLTLIFQSVYFIKTKVK